MKLAMVMRARWSGRFGSTQAPYMSWWASTCTSVRRLSPEARQTATDGAAAGRQTVDAVRAQQAKQFLIASLRHVQLAALEERVASKSRTLGTRRIHVANSVELARRTLVKLHAVCYGTRPS